MLTIQIIYRLIRFVSSYKKKEKKDLFYLKTVMNLIFLANYTAN